MVNQTVDRGHLSTVYANPKSEEIASMSIGGLILDIGNRAHLAMCPSSDDRL